MIALCDKCPWNSGGRFIVQITPTGKRHCYKHASKAAREKHDKAQKEKQRQRMRVIQRRYYRKHRDRLLAAANTRYARKILGA